MDSFAAVVGFDPPDFLASDPAQPIDMEEDELSAVDSVGEAAELSAYDKQRASLQTYLDSLPYECESIEDMQARLEYIVEKIYICGRTQNWLVLSTWDGMLQWYVLSDLSVYSECATHPRHILLVVGF